MSAPRPGALPSIFSLEPGTARQVRRGRLRERSDMPGRVDNRPRPAPKRAGVACSTWPTRSPSPSSPTACTRGCSRGARPGSRNAGVVVDDDGITVIDTLMVRSQWEPFAAAVQELDLPVRRTVLTHAHIDHVGGTKAFPASAIYGTPVTSDALDQPDAARRLQAVHARVRRGVRRPRRARHPTGHAPRRRRRAAHAARRGAPRVGAHRGRPDRARRRRRRAASPATCASSA